MRTLKKLLLWGIPLFVVAILAAGFVATWYKHRQEQDSTSDEQKLARTLEIIRTSTPEHPKVLKVLFYGQSITRSGWTPSVVDHWHQLYPNTVFVTKNRALGGFPAQDLIRATEQDIAEFYPDLIIFHVYGDHRAYAKIMRLFRSRTTADIIVQTDHGDVMPDPRCDEGLHLTLHAPPGCAGHFWFHQRMWNDEMSYHKIPAIAKEYGIAVEPQRGWWRDYFLSTGTKPAEFLIDEVHPNDRGKQLIAGYFNRYFDGLVSKYNGEHESDVKTITPTDRERASGSETIQFEGSRLELISSKPLPTWPTVTIDGQSPATFDGCYVITRPSPLETIPDWPIIRRITIMHDHVAEDWTATLTNFSADQKNFAFTVQGSKSGEQGSGTSSQPFVSSNGKLEIDPDDWMVERAWLHTHVALHAPLTIHWSVNYVCGGQPEIADLGHGAMEYRYVVAAGLPDAPHTIAIQGPVEDFRALDHFLAYSPRIHTAEVVDGW
jgi:hypothetical protein